MRIWPENGNIILCEMIHRTSLFAKQGINETSISEAVKS